jgi:hypothetical protein
MPTLPNIFPATNNDSFRDDEMSKLSAVPHKGTESFDHLMTRALSPSAPKTNASKVPDADGAAAKNIFDGAGKANGAQASATLNVGSVIKNSAEVEPNIKTAVGNFPVQPKNSKTSPQALETGRTKKCSDQSGAGVNSAAPISVNGATANPEIVAAQISPPATALEPAKAAVDISMTEAAIVVLVRRQKFFTDAGKKCECKCAANSTGHGGDFKKQAGWPGKNSSGQRNSDCCENKHDGFKIQLADAAGANGFAAGG